MQSFIDSSGLTLPPYLEESKRISGIFFIKHYVSGAGKYKETSILCLARKFCEDADMFILYLYIFEKHIPFFPELVPVITHNYRHLICSGHFYFKHLC